MFYYSLFYVADKISAPRDLRFTALSVTSASFEWAMPSLCGHFIDIYNIQIFNHLHNISLMNTTSLTTSVNVTGLSQGVEYNIAVFGRNFSHDGEKAELLMTLDGT